MQSFQAVCAKNNQKIELIVQYNSLEEARQSLHAQGYSIIEIKEAETKENQGKVFYFDIILDGNKKSGQIQSADIFKAYIKLVDDLHYQVTSIYEDIDATEEEKKSTMSKLRSWYLLYQEQNIKKEVKKEEKVEQTTQVQAAYSDISNTFVWREVQKYYVLIDKILQKIETILDIYGSGMEPLRRDKLRDFLVALKQLKNTTNVDKLRIVSESTLLKIGELELELLGSNKTAEKQGFLDETNELLRQFWSWVKVRNPETDMFLKIRRIVRNAYMEFFTKKETTPKENQIDTQSFVFYKNLRELNLYKEKLHTTQKALFIATVLFRTEKVKRLSIRRKLIVQNIQLIEKRIKNVSFSYTNIVKGFRYYTDVGIFLLQILGNYALYAIFIYSLFLFYISLDGFHSFNYSVLFVLVILSFFSFLTRMIRNGSYLVWYVGIFVFFCVFLQLNF